MKTLGATETPPVVTSDDRATPALAAVMTGATAALLVYVLKGPIWASVLTGAAAALVTKVAIDKSAATAA